MKKKNSWQLTSVDGGLRPDELSGGWPFSNFVKDPANR